MDSSEGIGDTDAGLLELLLLLLEDELDGLLLLVSLFLSVGDTATSGEPPDVSESLEVRSTSTGECNIRERSVRALRASCLRADDRRKSEL